MIDTGIERSRLSGLTASAGYYFVSPQSRLSTREDGVVLDHSNRTRLDGLEGARIWTGQGILAHNLVKIGAFAA